MQPADLDLARRLRTGDESAFEQFFAEYFPRVYRFARVRLGGDDDAAEEVAQVTLIRALAKVDTYRGEAALFTWLCAFARHQISAWFERTGKARRVSLADDSAETRAVLDALAALSRDDPEQDTRAASCRDWCTRRSTTCRSSTATRWCGSTSRADLSRKSDGDLASATRRRNRC